MRKLLLSLLSACMTVMLLCACAQAEGGASLLLLASSEAPLPADYVPDGLRQISAEQPGVNLVTSRSMLLQEEALEALYRLMRAADRSGVKLYVRQAYRSYADEARRYDLLSASGQVAHKPGESSYQTGLSVALVGADWRTEELTEAFANSKEAKWLSEHAVEYGFVLRYPEGKENVTGWMYEPWHYRYVGVDTAAIMAAQEICLEELPTDPAERSLWTVEDDGEETEEIPGPQGQETADKTGEPEAADETDEPNAPAVTEEPKATEEPTMHKRPSTTPGPGATGEYGPDGDYEISLLK